MVLTPFVKDAGGVRVTYTVVFHCPWIVTSPALALVTATEYVPAPDTTVPKFKLVFVYALNPCAIPMETEGD